ncbi:MAG: FabA/FabZ family ACP-dehydratase [Flavobacteriaceae bacterium]
MKHKEIISKLPYTKPFLFVDELVHVDDFGAEGSFTFTDDMDFYQGHFKDHPVTPGVLLTECCAQIGLVCLGIYLIGASGISNMQIGMSSAEMEFFEPVFPNETVTVTSKKLYFRFHKLKCEVRMHNSEGKLVCKGTIAGMLRTTKDA